MLFNKIQDGEFDLSGDDWAPISADAKDLIKNMLVRNPNKRYHAFQVLQHRWVAQEASRSQLATPGVLQRENSINWLEVCADNANACNRHLSIQEAWQAPVIFHPGERPWVDLGAGDGDDEDRLDSTGGDRPYLTPRAGAAVDNGDDADLTYMASHGRDDGGDHGLMFSIGDSSDEQSSGDDDIDPTTGLATLNQHAMWMSRPGRSALARRRTETLTSSGDSFDTVIDKENLSPPPATGAPPHKIASSVF